MSGRILVVDALPTNRIIMRVKLSAAFYEVVQAASGEAAIAMMRQAQPDLVITAAELPDMSGQDLCAALRKNPQTERPPVVVIHGENQEEEKLESLRAGADDVLSRPVNDLVLLARLRSLLRARDAEAELLLREDTRRALGLFEEPATYEVPAQAWYISMDPLSDQTKAMVKTLEQKSGAKIHAIPRVDALRDRKPDPDVIIVAEHSTGGSEGLPLISQFRASGPTRHAAMIYVAQSSLGREAASALDIGANDILPKAASVEELAIRIRKQVARKRANDQLRHNMRDGLKAAVTDSLTGLYNRRYTTQHLDRLAERSATKRRSYAIMLADLDFFKQVNDQYGHAAGDEVLRVFSQRLKDNLRAADLLSRWGGEEFLIAMPDTDIGAARASAQRICDMMARSPITLPDGQEITVTLSAGVAIGRAGQDVEALIAQADQALYTAKDRGRNQVVAQEHVSTVAKLRANWRLQGATLPDHPEPPMKKALGR